MRIWKWKWIEKKHFPFWKTKFGTHWEFCAYHRIFGFWKGPSGFWVKVKMCITKLRSVYIIYWKYYALNEVILLGFLQFWGFLWLWKLTLIRHWMNFDSPILFPWWLKVTFFTRCLYFHHNWWKKRGTKINSSNIFEGSYWGKLTFKNLNIYSKNWTP